MRKNCVIVGAGDLTGTQLHLPEGAYLIAADAGLNYLRAQGLKPDLIVGDFDSLGNVPQGDNVLVSSPEKDDTDMLLAVKQALSRGFEQLLIYGGLGGRLDHTLANLQTLSFIADRGAQGFLIGCGSVCTVVKNACLSVSSGAQGTVSVFSWGGQAEGVTLKGLKYPLENYTLSNAFPIGVSNLFTGSEAKISVREGALLVIWNTERFNPDVFTTILEI